MRPLLLSRSLLPWRSLLPSLSLPSRGHGCLCRPHGPLQPHTSAAPRTRPATTALTSTRGCRRRPPPMFRLAMSYAWAVQIASCKLAPLCSIQHHAAFCTMKRFQGFFCSSLAAVSLTRQYNYIRNYRQLIVLASPRSDGASISKITQIHPCSHPPRASSVMDQECKCEADHDRVSDRTRTHKDSALSAATAIPFPPPPVIALPSQTPSSPPRLPPPPSRLLLPTLLAAHPPALTPTSWRLLCPPCPTRTMPLSRTSTRRRCV